MYLVFVYRVSYVYRMCSSNWARSPSFGSVRIYVQCNAWVWVWVCPLNISPFPSHCYHSFVCEWIGKRLDCIQWWDERYAICGSPKNIFRSLIHQDFLFNSMLNSSVCHSLINLIPYRLLLRWFIRSILCSFFFFLSI